MDKKYKQLTISDIEAIHDKLQIVDKARAMLRELLKLGRQYDFWDSMDKYCEAKRLTLDYVKHLRDYRKDLLNGLYKCEECN